MEKGKIVIVNLQNPREKVLGILLEINSAGITVRGVDVNSFNDWTNSFITKEETEIAIFPSTVFYPMHRVLSCYVDEDAGGVPSFSSQFKRKTAVDLKDVLK